MGVQEQSGHLQMFHQRCDFCTAGEVEKFHCLKTNTVLRGRHRAHRSLKWNLMPCDPIGLMASEVEI